MINIPRGPVIPPLPALPAPLTAEVKLRVTPPTPFIRPQGSSAAWQTLSVLSLTGLIRWVNTAPGPAAGGGSCAAGAA